MEKTMLEKEITMTRFLSLFLGVNPAQARNITHKDAAVLFSNLVSYTDTEFYTNVRDNDMVNYARVKDKDKKIMYYLKPTIKERFENDECTDLEFNSNFELENLLLEFQDIDLSSLDKWELCELKDRLKLIKAHNSKILNDEISAVKKQLKKLKKEGK